MNKSKWTTNSSRKVEKQIAKFPSPINDFFELLKGELEECGRAGDGWPKIGPIWEFGKNRKITKVHLNTDRPIYVVVYEIFKKEKIARFLYAGTHENAPYGR